VYLDLFVTHIKSSFLESEIVYTTTCTVMGACWCCLRSYRELCSVVSRWIAIFADVGMAELAALTLDVKRRKRKTRLA